MIKNYKKEKIIQLIIAIIFLIYLTIFTDLSNLRIGGFLLVIIFGLLFQKKLLTDVKTENEFYYFETYSIITKKELIKISKHEIIQINYKSSSIFNPNELIINYNGTNGIMTKKFHLNTEPWSELNNKLNRMKKTIANTV